MKRTAFILGFAALLVLTNAPNAGAQLPQRPTVPNPQTSPTPAPSAPPTAKATPPPPTSTTAVMQAPGGEAAPSENLPRFRMTPYLTSVAQGNLEVVAQ